MNPLIEAIQTGWGWKLGTPTAVLATNRFGNVIVQTSEGVYFRIIPEELQCTVIARSVEELKRKQAEAEFVLDWNMDAIVARAEATCGRLGEGQCYYLVKPGVLGGEYAKENIRKNSLIQVLELSGDLAQQIEKLPNGTRVQLVVEAKPKT